MIDDTRPDAPEPGGPPGTSTSTSAPPKRSRHRKRRGRGEGSIYEKRPGLWVSIISDGYGADGKRQRASVYGANKQEVQDKLADLQAKARTGQLVKPSKQTVAEYLDWWVENVIKPNRRESTTIHRELMVRLHIVPYIGNVNLAKLRDTDVEYLYRRLREDGCSPRLTQMCGTVLHSALKHAKRRHLVTVNVTEDVDHPKAPAYEPKVLDAEQAEAFLEAARGDRLEALHVLALGTGMRQGEVLGLQWQHVDLKASTVSVQQQLIELKGKLYLSDLKTKKSRRQVKLPAFVVTSLKAHRERMFAEGHAAADMLVFLDSITGAKSRPVSNPHGGVRKSNLRRRSFDVILGRARVCAKCSSHDVEITRTEPPKNKGGRPRKDAPKPVEVVAPVQAEVTVRCRACGGTEGAKLPEVRFHDLRHSTATLLLKKGVHPKVVQEMLGHSRVGITLDTYSHVLPGMQDEAANALDGLLGGKR